MLERWIQPMNIVRRYATGRNYYIKGGSLHSKDILTPEVKDLLKNKKNFDNIEYIKPTVERETLPENEAQDQDYDQIRSKIVYYASGNKEIDDLVMEAEYSPVFLVSRVKTLKHEPYWHKRTCESIGLGQHARIGKVVALPNLPSFSKKLYDVKHLVKITPIRFPSNFDTKDLDPSHCDINLNTGALSVFDKVVLPSIDELSQESGKSLLTKSMLKKEARNHWEHPWNSPLGNSNYHRNTTHQHADKFDRVTDSAHKVYSKILKE
uniref:39S ribosomal protein L30, mitochondrial n=1 Tax=Lepeophtheirus salmonis TaxID=72036 RepID=D3PG09_LEPSM|nr:39S ribosomal protein L30, mitochondrial [Lepeophtheirus salmonis]